MRMIPRGLEPFREPAKTAVAKLEVLPLVSPTLPFDAGKNHAGRDRPFRENAAMRLSSLTPRQSLVLDHILAGSPSKTIAFDLHISQRTVENHRAAITRKMGARSLSALIHSAICGRSFLEDGCGLMDGASMPAISPRALPVKLMPPPSSATPVAHAITDTAGMAMYEIQHRLKNIVAVVQSLSNQTLRQCETKEDFSERFSARLGAYCRSLDLLSATNWSDVDLGTLVDAQLQSFGIRDSEQITAHGAHILVSPAAANSIGLALHELATNALKYGALSRSTGRVRVSWGAIGLDGFRMSWRETGGPIVAEPQHRGFGRRLLEDLAALAVSGTSSCSFEPLGVAWTFECPARALHAA